jgi:acyl-CoA thioesterase I
MMQQMTGVPVKNLSRPGAGTIEAHSMADGITTEDRVVLLEVGGNDMLAGVRPDEFARALDSLLSTITAPARAVVMFELPVFPSQMAYGQIQRRLAAKYRVWLIPKRFLVDILGGAKATSDGLHLSEAGARHMAVVVTQALPPVLKSPDHKLLTRLGVSQEPHRYSGLPSMRRLVGLDGEDFGAMQSFYHG